MKYLLLCVLFIPIYSPVALAQTVDENIVPIMKNAPRKSFPGGDSVDFTVGEVRGSVQNKALFLPKPIYPDDARRLGIEGVVRVQVKINEQGFVVDASMLSGDPLLKTFAEDAASKSKFRPLLDNSGRAISSEGVLSYSFEIRKVGWSRFAADLLRLEGSVVSVPVLLKSLNPEWTDELATLKRLSEIAGTGLPRFVPVRTIENKQLQSKTRSSTMTATITLPTSPLEQGMLVQDMVTSIRKRLADDELSLWQFEAGLDIVRAFYLSTMIQTPRNNNPNRFIEASIIISNRLSKLPNGVSDEVVTALKKLEKNLGIEKRTKEIDDEISASIVTILQQSK
jgi:TonB family protein